MKSSKRGKKVISISTLHCSQVADTQTRETAAHWGSRNRLDASKSRGLRGSATTKVDTGEIKTTVDGKPSNYHVRQCFVAPRTPSEKLMASLWADILNLDKISLTDNFFDYGRDSFLAMEIVARVRKVFAVDLSVRTLFEDPTVAGMTAAVLKSQYLQHQTSSSAEASPGLWNARKRAERLLSKAK